MVDLPHWPWAIKARNSTACKLGGRWLTEAKYSRTVIGLRVPPLVAGSAWSHRLRRRVAPGANLAPTACPPEVATAGVVAVAT